MKADFDLAATKAMEMLIKYRISYAPVTPIPMLKGTPGVLLLTYADIADTIGVDRSCVINNLHADSRDASTAVDVLGGSPHYVVAYNKLLPAFRLQRALARELGHIALGHDGTRPEDVRTAEALVFSRHLLCPRPLVRALADAGLRLTAPLLTDITGLDDQCLACLSATPGARVPAQLNRIVRDQFAPYVANLRDYYAALPDGYPLADLGTYMDNYEE